jgi:hypothetical protein
MVPKKIRDRHIDWELITSFEFYTLIILKLGLYDVKKDELLKYQAIKVRIKYQIIFYSRLLFSGFSVLLFLLDMFLLCIFKSYLHIKMVDSILFTF